MPLPALVSLNDFEEWLSEPVLGVAEARARAVLSAASTRVRSHTGRTWVDADGERDPSLSDARHDAAATVALMVATRLWHNPHLLKQTTTGPFSSTFGPSGLELTEDEKSLLAEPPATGVPGLTSVRLEAPSRAAGVPRSRWSWCDEDDGS